VKLRLTRQARADMAAVFKQSREQFGEDAQRRYERLLNATMRELAVDPQRPGVREASSGPQGLRLYHTRHASRRMIAGDRVGRPRHIIVYRVVGDEVRILRLLHDAMDLPPRLRDL
jgi:toxin ParE1/3/4